MEKVNVLLKVFMATLILVGCSEDNVLTPELNSDNSELVSLKSTRGIKTEFSGQCHFIELINAGDTIELPNGKTMIRGITSKWQDISSDWRVSGVSVWDMNWMIEEDGITTKIVGKAEIFLDNERGKWELSYRASIVPTDNGMLVTDYCNGIGTEGEVKGLVAKWIHVMDFNPIDPSSFVYNFTGYYH